MSGAVPPLTPHMPLWPAVDCSFTLIGPAVRIYNPLIRTKEDVFVSDDKFNPRKFVERFFLNILFTCVMAPSHLVWLLVTVPGSC
jgi:hypothetical protein